MTASWRNVLKIHPAAEIDPLMSEAELRALGEDIKKNGLQSPVTIYDDQLLDGRNRLDGMESAGIALTEFWEGMQGEEGMWVIALEDADIESKGPIVIQYDRGQIDPWAYVASANHHRRHLSPEDKRDRIAALLKAQPEKSNRTIAKETKVDHKTVGAVRERLEAGGEIPHHDQRKDARGTMQRAHKKRAPQPPAPVEPTEPPIAPVVPQDAEPTAAAVIPASTTTADPVSVEEVLARECRNIILAALSKARRAGTICDREILAATSRIICALRGKLNEFEPDDIQVRLTKRAPASPAVARLGELQDGGDA
jgi:hypothetical protein